MSDPFARLFRREQLKLGTGLAQRKKLRRCNRCETTTSYINKSGIDNWRKFGSLYYCKKCHEYLFTGGTYSLWQRAFNWLERFRKCSICDSNTTSLREGKQHWYSNNKGDVCYSCYQKYYHSRLISIGGKYILCAEPPRTGECEKCKRSVDRDIITKTFICPDHNWAEYCFACHLKEHPEVLIAIAKAGKNINKYLGSY